MREIRNRGIASAPLLRSFAATVLTGGQFLPPAGTPTAIACMRASGVSPQRVTAVSEAMRTAAAASEIWLAWTAVRCFMPGSRLSPAIFSSDVTRAIIGQGRRNQKWVSCLLLTDPGQRALRRPGGG